MPCESCNTQFSVFKRKRSCSECRRLYCNHCLVKRRDKLLCERCVVFTTRPLTKVELLKLKPKDLIFYLQSKHISTTGCVEKDELVNLVLAHIDSTRLPSDHESFRSFGNSPTGNSPESNPFDQIRQTCQNLFQSFTDKIATDLNFDIKPSSSGQQQNIFSQPRSSTRHSQSNRSHNSSTTTTSINENIVLNNIPLSSPSSPPTPPVPRNPINTSLSAASSPPSNSDNNSVASSRITSPSNSTCDDSNSAASIKSSARMSNNRDPTVPTIITKKNIPNDLPSVHSNNLGNENKSTKKFFDKYSSDINGSGCECSEDEAIRHQKSKHKKMSQSTSNLLTTEHPNLPGPSGSGNMTKNYRENKHPIKANNGCNSDSLEESSSFEELGAVGRNSSDVDTWQFINKNFEVEFDEEDQNSRRHQNEFAKKKLHKKVKNSYKCDNEDTGKASNNNFLQYQHKQQSTSNSQEETASSSGEVSSRIRKLTRRRSDSCIIQSPSHKYDNAEFGDRNVDEDSSRKRSRKSCQRCGKTKNDLKKHVIRFRRQLEILHTSDVEVKQQLDAVLKFLENKTKSSFECSDTDSQSNHSENDHEPVAVNSETARREHSQEHNFMNENDGIYVYPTIRTETVRPTINIEKPRIYVRQYVKLDDISSSSDLEDLTVKQLKEILMLNRVDFKGCCEKTELLERVRRLWKDHRSSPSVDKLPTDDLCKICMDAPIECVILECGHMASCTNCGKVLNECPICRQYIVRVVRFFRA